MDYKKANLAYLLMILSTLALVVVLTVVYIITGKEPSVVGSNALCEAACLVPAIAVVLFNGDRLSALIPFHKIRISSALLTLLYVILLFPMVIFLNALSMLFVENAVSSISDQILGMPLWVMLLSVGIFGPFVEEVVFRGVILQTYQRTGRILASMILSSVLFGMMHMNFNQFIYGAGMGLMLALLVEATGSVLTSFIAHAFFNSIEVLMMFMSDESALDEAVESSDFLSGGTASVVMMLDLLGVAAIFTVIAFCVVTKIADLEGRRVFFSSILKREKREGKLVSTSLVVAMIVAVIYMVYTALIDKISL